MNIVLAVVTVGMGDNYGLCLRPPVDPDGAWRIHYERYAAIKGSFLRNKDAYCGIRHAWAVKLEKFKITPTSELKSSQEFRGYFFNCQFQEICYPK
jgi:hypothetical protein